VYIPYTWAITRKDEHLWSGSNHHLKYSPAKDNRCVVGGQGGKVIRQTTLNRLKQTEAHALFIDKRVQRLGPLTLPEGEEGALTNGDFRYKCKCLLHKGNFSWGFRASVSAFLKITNSRSSFQRDIFWGGKLCSPSISCLSSEKYHRKFADKFSYSLLRT